MNHPQFYGYPELTPVRFYANRLSVACEDLQTAHFSDDPGAAARARTDIDYQLQEILRALAKFQGLDRVKQTISKLEVRL